MKKTFITFLLSLTSFSISHAQNTTNSLSSNSINSSEWNKMITNFDELKKHSSTPFQKWHVDMMHFNLLTCSHMFKLPLSETLKNHKVSKAGSYSLIKESVCIGLKDGLNYASCDRITAYEKPFTSIPKGFYLYQGIFVDQKERIPPPNSKIRVGMKCKLVKNNKDSEQLYFGEATVMYDKIRPNTFNTQLGSKNVLQASIMLKIDGLNTLVGPTNLIQLR